MKDILKLEELGMFILAIFGLFWLHCAWWYYLLMVLAPDLSMLGYWAGKKVGAASYNFFHHKGIATAVFIAGFEMKISLLMITGIILFGHSSMDRIMGYGLKTEKGFKFTHLGKIGD